jgi:catechol 2,3-dioxygenase-like lactoylglutathione lyase family enzyme
MSHLSLAAVVVADYDTAIAFFVAGLGFELVEDSPALTTDGGPNGGSSSSQAFSMSQHV